MCTTQPKKATLFHILNNCDGFLGEKERMTWRHNSILSYMVETLKENAPDNIQIFGDLNGHNINGGTIPQNIITTTSRPDLVILDNSQPTATVYLFELTVCFERYDNILSANRRKHERYVSLAEDIREAGYICKNIPFEIGSRGHITGENKSKLAIMHQICHPKINYTKFWQNISKTSLLCSYTIYLSRNDTWSEIPFLVPVKK